MSARHDHWIDIRILERLSSLDSPFHRVHPVIQLVVTLAYTGVVASFPVSAVTPLMALCAYPALCIALGGLPARTILVRVAAVLPVAALLGAASPLLDRVPVNLGPGITVARGWLTMLAILVRATLVTTGALCLTALTGFEGLCAALARLGLPRVLVTHLRLMFRYLSTLSGDVGRALEAYRLRGGKRGVAPRVWGGLAGGLLVRSLDRAERVHHAMLCRGGDHPSSERTRPFRPSDWLYLATWSTWFAVCRVVDISAVAGEIARAAR